MVTDNNRQTDRVTGTPVEASLRDGLIKPPTEEEPQQTCSGELCFYPAEGMYRLVRDRDSSIHIRKSPEVQGFHFLYKFKIP